MNDYRRNQAAYALEPKIKTIRIPYWLQLDQRMIWYLFGAHSNDFNSYPHGFWAKNVVLPGSFSKFGTKRFLEELEWAESAFDKSYYVYGDILRSLGRKLVMGKDISDCFPWLIDDDTIDIAIFCMRYEFEDEIFPKKEHRENFIKDVKSIKTNYDKMSFDVDWPASGDGRWLDMREGLDERKFKPW